MQYESLLRLTLIPTILLFILCTTTVVVTVANWIVGDWIVYRFITVVMPNGSRNEIMIDYVQTATDACIISGCIGLGAAIVGVIAWFKLRRSDMDMQQNLPRRRFWVGFALLMATAVFAASLAALTLHYTTRGSDKNGCNSIPDGIGGQIYECTREAASCNLQPTFVDILDIDDAKQESGIKLACSLSQAAKWLQLVLALNAIALVAMFAAQAWLRRKARYARVHGKEGVYPSQYQNNDSQPEQVQTTWR